ncbi:MAG: cation-translocating P-type ATPase [Planctomycetes bacterium]|nr:cation-translocating P-type ATPase [Planctomycetota bacterium]
MNSVHDRFESCDYCGLPMPRPWFGSSAPRTGEPAYCCFGCRIAAEATQQAARPGTGLGTLAKLGLAVFFTLNVSVFTMALWTRDVYGSDPSAGRLGPVMDDLFRYLALVLSLPVLLLLGRPLVESGLQELRRGRITTDLLLVLGVAASYGYSAVSVFRHAGHVYFEVGCVILVMVTLGRWLEAVGKHKAVESLASLERLLPETVRMTNAHGERAVPVQEIRSGDLLRVLPGERIPVDGRITRGVTTVDQQVLNGESQPAVKETGDQVFGGTLNLDGDVSLQVTAAATDGTLSRLIQAVQDARRRKGRYEQVADRAAAWFVPLVAVVALIALIMHTRQSGFEHGLLTMLAVVLIACPCALGIATPLAVWTGLGRASQSQVLFRNGEALERLAGVRVLCFDKTGTLTTGTAEVEEFIPDDDKDYAEVLTAAAALASSSLHVLSASVVRFARPRVQRLTPWEHVTSLAGRGVQGAARTGEPTAYLGSLRFMQESGQQVTGRIGPVLQQAADQGSSVAALGCGGRVRGAFVFREDLRPEAREALEACRRLGLTARILTGDHMARAALMAAELQIPAEAGLLPEDKLRAVARARATLGPVAMIGDGINDAPALAAADVGVALGCGADVARDSAEVCLLGNDLRRLPWAVELARRTVRVIRQNLFWSFSYNVAGIGLAAMGWLNPIFAAFAMAASSLLVVGNSLRLASMPLPLGGEEK